MTEAAPTFRPVTMPFGYVSPEQIMKDRADYARKGIARGRAVLVMTYAEAAPQETCALFGSTDHLEIAVNSGSASERLNLTRGAPVTIRKT